MHTYYRPQKYNVKLTVQDDKGATGSFSQLIEVNAIKINNKPIVIGLQPDKLSPQETGSTITWSVDATDSDDDPLQFQFSLDGQIMQDWSDSPVWSWTATEEQVGVHVIKAKSRDGKHNAGVDSSKIANFEIVLSPNDVPGNNVPVMSSLTTDKESPQVTGTAVTWTVVASDPEDDPIFYKFWLLGPTTGNAWMVVQDWSTKNQWTWTNAPTEAGRYTVFVYARDGKHAPAAGYDSVVGREFILLESISSLQSELISNENALKINPYDENAKKNITRINAQIDTIIDMSFKPFE